MFAIARVEISYNFFTWWAWSCIIFTSLAL